MGLRVLRWVVVMVGLVIGATPVAAQLRVQVVDETGAGVAEATVEVWSPVRRLGMHQTNMEGTVVLQPADVAGARRLWVRRIGFRPMELTVRPTDETIVARMEPMIIVPVACVPGEIFPEYTGPGRLRPDQPDAACPPTVIQAHGGPATMLTGGVMHS